MQERNNYLQFFLHLLSAYKGLNNCYLCVFTFFHLALVLNELIRFHYYTLLKIYPFVYFVLNQERPKILNFFFFRSRTVLKISLSMGPAEILGQYLHYAKTH